MSWKTNLYAVAIAWVAAQPSAVTAETELLGSFGYWSAFQYDTDCWVATEPADLTVTQAKVKTGDGELYLMIAFKYGSTMPSVQIWLSEEFGDILLASAVVRGTTHPLFYSDEALWLPVDSEVTVVKQLLGGNDLKLSVEGEGTTEIAATYSTEGLQEAYNHMARFCN
ncbi:hypothetical protein [Roseovarius sp. SYSU LYC5161]|uniref:hypothetical protein n=1 Tax=Roseovarius halophilus (ex Wu et al. 2025) TaxID=3376060 RepID=UPI00399ACC01